MPSHSFFKAMTFVIILSVVALNSTWNTIACASSSSPLTYLHATAPMLSLDLLPLVYDTNPCFVRFCKHFSHSRLPGSNRTSIFFKYQLFEQRARATGPFALVTQRTPSSLARVRCGFEDDFFDTQVQRGNTKKCFAGCK